MIPNELKHVSSRPSENFVTVLAIYDEPPSSSSQQLKLPDKISEKSSTHNLSSAGRLSDNIDNLEQVAPTIISIDSNVNNEDDSVLIIQSPNPDYSQNNGEWNQQSPSNTPLFYSDKDAKEIFQKSTDLNISEQLRSFHARDSSKESQSGRSASLEPQFNSLSRNNARKSRFTDAFLDAKERLEMELEQNSNSLERVSRSSSNFKQSKIVLSPESLDIETGIEISAIPDPNNPKQLIAVEVVRIEEEGRVALDGRLKVGDQITEINGTPCSQISLARARLYLSEFDSIPCPSIVFNRQVQTSFKNNGISNHSTSDSTSTLVLKPIKTALQQGNTSKIGQTMSFSIMKRADGFGFSFAGRLNAQNEHLFYVKTVKNGGASSKFLKMGDRLLKIDDVDLKSLQQSDVTSILKSKLIGDTIIVEISRIWESSQDFNSQQNKNEQLAENKLLSEACTPNKVTFNENFLNEIDDLEKELGNLLGEDGRELIKLNIALNDSPSAGLGLSLKAQRKYNGGEAIDSGLYIRSVLHGSAAYKDGRLRIDDQLVAIENINLLRFNINAEALDALGKCFSLMPSNTSSVNVFVARKKEIPDLQTAEFNVNRTLIPVSPEVAKKQVECSGKEHPQAIDGSESDVSQIPDNNDGASFIRDTASRKSISEKRPLGSHNDPSHLQTYQRIKHFRQTSAPAINSLAEMAPLDMASMPQLRNQRRSLGNHKIHRQTLFVPTSTPLESIENEIFKDSTNNNNNIRSQRPLTCYQDNNINNRNLTAIQPQKSSFKIIDFFKNVGQKKHYAIKNAETNEFSSKDKENIGPTSSSPKRRSISIEPLHSLNTGSFRDIKKEENSTKHDYELDLKKQEKGLPNSLSQPAISSAFKNYEQVPLSNLRDGKNRNSADILDKRQRRKSTGSGLLKFFQKSSISSQNQNTLAQNLHNGDEKTLLKYNTLMDEKQKFYSTNPFDFHNERNLLLENSTTNPQQIPKGQIPRRRAPPPPYEQHFSSPIYANTMEIGTTNNNQQQQNFYHQRGYSEQDSSMRDCNKSEFVVPNKTLGVIQSWNEAHNFVVNNNNNNSNSTNQTKMETQPHLPATNNIDIPVVGTETLRNFDRNLQFQRRPVTVPCSYTMSQKYTPPATTCHLHPSTSHHHPQYQYIYTHPNPNYQQQQHCHNQNWLDHKGECIGSPKRREDNPYLHLHYQQKIPPQYYPLQRSILEGSHHQVHPVTITTHSMPGSHIVGQFPKQSQRQQSNPHPSKNLYPPKEDLHPPRLKHESRSMRAEEANYWDSNRREKERAQREDKQNDQPSRQFIPQHLSMRPSEGHYPYSTNIAKNNVHFKSSNKNSSTNPQTNPKYPPSSSKSLSKSFNYKKTDLNPHRDSYETVVSPRRSSRQQSSSRMRKAVASAVFYDDFEHPVHC